ncbi:MAG: preprotein translocase subunit SecA [SAR324 cluster bacterium]|nr:preprotein translocase subunit SecA [SAR324 cluster bacterium]
MNSLLKFFGNTNKKTLKRYKPLVAKINELEPAMKQLKDADFAEKTREFRTRLQNGEALDALLPEAFALVREASLRIIGERHYDVQLIGGIALHEGNIAEMQTGEGKTLASTCPAYLNALPGKGVHIVTPNDYLARRDSQWMGKIYGFLGLTVGLIQHGYSDQERKDNYNCDITYGTNNEFGFDYLRDNMKFSKEDFTQRGYHYAIVDEVDSILVDEARTPLIISGPTEDNIDKYGRITRMVFGLKREIHKEEVSKLLPEENYDIHPDWEVMEDHDVVRTGDYSLDEKSRNTNLTEHGAEKIEERLKAAGMLKMESSLYDFENIEILHHVTQALKAHYVFRKDVDYVVQNRQVVIVDEFTGRLMPGRRFSDGLHQALEAKESVPVERENQTLATITFQNYFRLYEKLGGMTGTAETEKEEFKKIYNLGVVVIPTNRQVVRIDHPDVIFKTVKAKYLAVVNHIKQLYATGQPVLVGTVSIEVSETLSRMLHQAKIPHEVLNAKHHEREAEIISLAGHFKSVTIATNMAGRGTDIKPTKEALEVGGLFVLGTGRHDSRRIDNQLRGRSGRQGDPGASQFYLSLEDELLRIFGGERISKMMDRLNIDENEPIEHVLISKAISNAQKKVEGHHFEIRKHVLEYDDVMNRQRTVMYGRRRDILEADIKSVFLDMSDEIIEEFMELYCSHKYSDQWAVQEFNQQFINVFGMIPNEKWYEESVARDQYLDILVEYSEEVFNKKATYFLEVFRNTAQEGQTEAHFQWMSEDLTRHVILRVHDNLWKEHLLAMDHLREGIGLVGYAQKKPLDEYKRQGFEMFRGLIHRINVEAIRTFYHLTVNQTIVEPIAPKEPEMVLTHGNPEEIKATKPANIPVRKLDAVGRNELCPCGSGKKFKKCHGQIEQSA